MAKVRTFWISPKANVGVPDYKIQDFISECEKEMGYVSVNSIFIPPVAGSDPRITVVITKLDDAPEYVVTTS